MDPLIPRGQSLLMRGIELAGLSKDGVPIIGNANLFTILKGFTISAVPEPSSFTLIGLALLLSLRLFRGGRRPLTVQKLECDRFHGASP